MAVATNHSTYKESKWINTISRGDIALFAHPSAFKNHDKLINPTPYLVLEIIYVSGDMYVVLTAGTTVVAAPPRPFDIQITNKSSLNEAGLAEPISFDTNHRIIVPVLHSGFGMRFGATPVIGRLNSAGQYRLRSVRSPQKVLADRKTCLWAQQWFFEESCKNPRKRDQVIIPAPYSHEPHN
ncbi:hypothetical protein [Cohaesibacter intestini]|uniref:hypothetical protein n=1 Tax=Cohaesibacter intestini TaxID=2211145 RepID=UPI000DEA59EF|nr:hypothetical protein [Cohaesibacter intestini]